LSHFGLKCSADFEPIAQGIPTPEKYLKFLKGICHILPRFLALYFRCHVFDVPVNWKVNLLGTEFEDSDNKVKAIKAMCQK